MNKKTYYLLSLTWGMLMTLAGVVVALVLLILGYRPKRFCWAWYFEVGESWGGLSLGPIFLCDNGSSMHTMVHEFGHSIQNCMFGPAMVVFTLCSAARYHWHNWLDRRNKPVPDYYSWWLESQANNLGAKYYIFRR